MDYFAQKQPWCQQSRPLREQTWEIWENCTVWTHSRISLRICNCATITRTQLKVSVNNRDSEGCTQVDSFMWTFCPCGNVALFLRACCGAALWLRVVGLRCCVSFSVYNAPAVLPGKSQGKAESGRLVGNGHNYIIWDAEWLGWGGAPVALLCCYGHTLSRWGSASSTDTSLILPIQRETVVAATINENYGRFCGVLPCSQG